MSCRTIFILQTQPNLYKIVINQQVIERLMARERKAKILSEAEFNLLRLDPQEGKFSTRNPGLASCSLGLDVRVKEIANLALF